MWPSVVRSLFDAFAFWSVMAISLSLAPPPLMRRLTSPLDSARPHSMKRSRMLMPSSSRDASIVIFGRSSPTLPCSKTLAAVWAASCAACSP